MAVKIGHASIDEKGKIAGGKAGDQTAKELCIRNWYSKGWVYLLRCKDKAMAEKMAKACEDGCNNAKIGYDQYQRNTLHTQAKKVEYKLSKIKTACETDCSAFMTVCAIAGGVTALEYEGNAPTTSTMKNTFMKTGKFECFTSSKYLTEDNYLKRGDILIKPGSHTVMVLSNGSKTTSKVTYYKAYKGDSTSLVDALKSLNINTNFNYRKRIAEANGLEDTYRGSAEQNTFLLGLLRQGKLIKC